MMYVAVINAENAATFLPMRLTDMQFTFSKQNQINQRSELKAAT